MADVPTLAQVLGNVVPVIVGGLLAVGGGAATQWYLHTLKSEEEKRTRRVAKFEEFVTLLFEHKHWIERSRNIRVFGVEGGVEGVIALSPMARVQAIMSAYFPEFEEQVYALDIAADKFEIWMMTEGQKRLKKEPFGDAHKEASDPYLQLFHKLLGELRKFARREFNSSGYS